MTVSLALDQPCSARHPHGVRLYLDDKTLVRDVSDFVRTSLNWGAPAIVLGTPEHRESVDAALASAGIDVARTRAAGRYVALDASATLASFMEGERIDEDRFETVIGGLLRRVAGQSAGSDRIGVYGEMVALLARERRFEAALSLERHWNRLTHHYRLSLLCGYPAQAFDRPEDIGSLFDVCDLHTDVVNDASARANDAHDRAADALQQRAQLLDQHTAPKTDSVQLLPARMRPPSVPTVVRALHGLIDQHGLPLVIRAGGDRVTVTSRGMPAFELCLQARRSPIGVTYNGWLPDANGEGSQRWQPLWHLLCSWGAERNDFVPAAPGRYYPDLLDHLL